MILKLVAIYDKRALQYGAPMQYPTLGVAERSYMDAHKENPTMSKHPEDYILYYIGDYDTENGKITQAEKHTIVVDGFNLALLPE